MKIMFESSTAKGEISTNPSADVYDTVDAFVSALILDGFIINDVADAFYKKAKQLGFTPYDTKGND